jgi:hypothetical protein
VASFPYLCPRLVSGLKYSNTNIHLSWIIRDPGRMNFRTSEFNSFRLPIMLRFDRSGEISEAEFYTAAVAGGLHTSHRVHRHGNFGRRTRAHYMNVRGVVVQRRATLPVELVYDHLLGIDFVNGGITTLRLRP